MEHLAAMLGTSGPSSVPAAMMPAACAAKVGGSRRTIPSAMRRMSPLPFMPAPSANAATNSHQVLVENAASETDVLTPPITAKAATMRRPVAYSGSTPATHHTMAQHRMARHARPCCVRPTPSPST